MMADSAGLPHTGVSRRAHRDFRGVDVGVEDPIEADGGVHTQEDRRQISVRWLCGTILTGLAGALLIGSAIFVSLGNQYTFAEAPEIAQIARQEPAVVAGSVKGDRLVKSVDIVAAKQSFKAQSTVTAAGKEFIRARNFTRIATGLTLVTLGYADDVPEFDPLKIVAGSQNPAAGEQVDPGPLQDEAEVSFAVRDLTMRDASADRFGLSGEEVQAQITEYLKNALATGVRSPLPLPPQLLLMRTSRAGLGAAGLNSLGGIAGGLSYAPPDGGVIAAPFSNIEVRMVAENVTTIARSAAAAERGGAEETIVAVRRNESLEDILRNAGASRDLIRNIVNAFSVRRGQTPVTEGQRVKLLFAEINGPDQPRQIARLSVYTNENLESTVAMADNGAFVQVERAPPTIQRVKRRGADDDDDEEDTGGMKLYDSFYETALKNNLPRPLIDDLVRTFANDVDFQRSVRGGDNFEVFYDEGDDSDQRNEMLFAAITTRNETYKYYRFQTADDGLVDYYDENGRSTRKFLVRQPIGNARITSGFGGRFHPILGYTRMHTGVDFAAPMGTPIFAAGNGVVIKAGRESGYGNRAEIQHANGYITTYNHMTGFARGVTEGTRIKQGQLVGYLGMTGLATGPHLHYEVIVNGHFVDPMRVKLARTRELDGRQIALFKRERERIEGLIAKAPGATRVAAKQPN